MKMIAGACARASEEVPHSRRANAHNHLHELCGARQKTVPRFSCHRLRQQRLPCAGRTNQEDAFRSGSSQARVLIGVSEEIDDLNQLVLGFIDAGDIVEGNPRILLPVVAAGLVSCRCP